MSFSSELTNDFWSITLPANLATSSARNPELFAYVAAQNRLGAPVVFHTRRSQTYLIQLSKPKRRHWSGTIFFRKLGSKDRVSKTERSKIRLPIMHFLNGQKTWTLVIVRQASMSRRSENAFQRATGSGWKSFTRFLKVAPRRQVDGEGGDPGLDPAEPGGATPLPHSSVAYGAAGPPARGRYGACGAGNGVH